ncbi:MAG TPA: helix-turn-helix domain-containing protein [Candidatus Moranbacteria bacterium]|nr:helix-turn-helix domain-containing protein [Candidatus Moranbacteria bacterium]
MLEQELQKLGLSDKEARIYLASLQLGKSPVQEIAEQAKVNRGTAYDIIRSLMNKGLMSSFDQGKKTYFTAESPERLSSLIKIQGEELKLKEKEFSKYLPELRSMYGSADNKPKVKYYEGREGILAIQEECLKVKTKNIYGITCLDTVANLFPETFKYYSPKRISKGIQSKVIYTTINVPPLNHEDDKISLREMKHIPHEEFPFSIDITIFDNKVAFRSLNEEKPGGVIIEDKQIAESMVAIFNRLWEK